MAMPEGFDPNNPKCPKCNGPMWDNRIGKRSAQAPDFKCKNKQECDGAVWPSKSSKTAKAETAPATAVTQVVLSASERKALRGQIVEDYFKLMAFTARSMSNIGKEFGIPLEMKEVQAATFSLYSEMSKRRCLEEAAAAPAPPPAKSFREPPPEEEEDDLPF